MKMKNFILNLVAVVSLSVAFSGCYDLDIAPPDKISDALFWKTEAQVKQGMMGVYAAAKSQYAFGTDCMFDYLGDIALGYDAIFPGIPIGSYGNDYGACQNFWQYLYEVSARANTLISNVSKMTTISDEAKDAFIAEAKFLRAMTYFRLLVLYGGVPIYDETTNVNAEFANMLKPQNTPDEVRQYVINDLTFAISKLRVSWPTTDIGRATKGAAYALRGKVYLYNKEWDKAIADFDEIVYNRSNNYGYSLDPNFGELFGLYNGKTSPEMIFTIESKANGDNYGLTSLQYLSNKCTLRRMGNNYSVPSNDLVDMYEYPDGRPFNWDDHFPGFNDGDEDIKRSYLCVRIKPEDPWILELGSTDTAYINNVVYGARDSRLKASVITPFSRYLGSDSYSLPYSCMMITATKNGNQPAEQYGQIRNGNSSWFTYFWRKFVPTGNLNGYLHEWTENPFTFPLIRLADVLLMLSEAYNEANQLDNAVIELNKVRARVNMPGLNSGAAWMAVTSKEEMTARIRKERSMELAVEGHRFHDLRRWGIAKDVLHGKQALSIYGTLLYTHSFIDRDMLWPIPSVERERNPNLDQNLGWGN